LDYLERDSFYTIGERPGVEYLAKHVYFIDNDVMIDEVAIDSAKAIQEFYIKMSKNVYLRKKASILQRLIEKMTGLLVDDGLSEEELFELTDFGLLGRFELSTNKKVRFYYDNFIKGVFPKLALDFRCRLHDINIDFASKPLKVITFEAEIFDKILASPRLGSLNNLNQTEKEIANICGIPEEALLIVPPFSRGRFEPQDIKVYSRSGKTFLLSDIYPNHFQAMKEYGQSHLSLRLAVYNEYRKRLYDCAKDVEKYLRENL